ncbi:cytochrome C-552 [Elioraea sp.]|uniref:cytochrome C-552 n=1 Tax=Elioraea sp. TaxID=2185103 RepID=UPI0021DECEEE|nr:cytochrome C-552 [Elioraea sp.]GIX09736.1 MAG: hypothetical protein KatS3mg116_1446 [Elioraea sp.]
MRGIGAIVVVLALAGAGGAVPSPAAAQAPADIPGAIEEIDVLPEGEGREETFYTCTACHNTALIRRSGFTREQWDDLMDWMVTRQNMPPLETDQRKVIVDYLAEHFPPRRTRPGFVNPFMTN